LKKIIKKVENRIFFEAIDESVIVFYMILCWFSHFNSRLGCVAKFQYY